MWEQQPWRNWRHVVKLDPEREMADEVLQALNECGTDAIFLGGTQGVTFENANRLLGRVRRFAPDVPVWQELSSEESVVDGVDGYALPVVLNSGSVEWIIGAQARAIQRYRPMIDWSNLLVEGYVVLNPAAAVAKRTQAKADLSIDEAVAYAVAGESLFSLPVIYVEYSGMYGDPALVAELERVLRGTHVFYGGGLDSYDKAAAMAAHADTIIVGNALYEDTWQQALRETIRAAKGY